jgi:hypothetical protein
VEKNPGFRVGDLTSHQKIHYRVFRCYTKTCGSSTTRFLHSCASRSLAYTVAEFLGPSASAIIIEAESSTIPTVIISFRKSATSR